MTIFRQLSTIRLVACLTVGEMTRQRPPSWHLTSCQLTSKHNPPTFENDKTATFYYLTYDWLPPCSFLSFGVNSALTKTTRPDVVQLCKTGKASKNWEKRSGRANLSVFKEFCCFCCFQTLLEKVGRLEGWKVLSFEGSKIGRLEGWKVGRLEGWKLGRLEGWNFRRLEGSRGFVISPVSRHLACVTVFERRSHLGPPAEGRPGPSDDKLLRSYLHRKYMVCMVWNII